MSRLLLMTQLSGTLALLTICGAGCGTPCGRDADCPSGHQCVVAGGVLFESSGCVEMFGMPLDASVDASAGEMAPESDSTRDDARADIAVEMAGDIPDLADAGVGPGCDPLIGVGDSCDGVAEVHLGGYNVSCLRRESGVLACWGYNDGGVLGNGDEESRAVTEPGFVVDPADPSLPLRTSAFCVGDYFGCALDLGGTPWCWGYEQYLGVGTDVDWELVSPTPMRVTSSDPQFQRSTFEDLDCETSSACLVDTDGGLWCWGWANDGATNPSVPSGHVSEATRIALPEPVESVAMNWSTSCAIVASGSLYCWGQNRANNLGVDVPQDEVIGPTLVDLPSRVSSVSSDVYTSCALTDDRRVFCWGDVDGLVPGVIETPVPLEVEMPEPPDELRVGKRAACFRAADRVYCWGHRGGALIGDGTLAPGGIGPPQVEPKRIDALPPVQRLFGNRNGMCAIVDGVPWCWGSNTQDQLAREFNVVHAQPVRVALPDGAIVAEVTANGSGPCALTANELFCWGYLAAGVEKAEEYWAIAAPTLLPVAGPTSVGVGDFDYLAVSGSTTNRLHRVAGDGPISVENAPTTPRHVAETRDEICWTSRTSGAVSCDGTNRTDTNLGLSATELEAGFRFFCARETGTRLLHCWGRGSYGQLGNGTTPSNQVDPTEVTRLGPVARFHVSDSHTCAIQDPDGDGEGPVACWGWNGSGQVGAPADSFPQVASPNPVALPRNAVDVTGGWSHSCAVLTNDEVWCFGSNRSREGGRSQTSHAPAQVPDVLATRVFAAGATTLAVDATDPTITWCWGSGIEGACGTGAETYSAVPEPMRNIGPAAPAP